MQINMRKILAVLSVLAMLCTVLPLSVFAADAEMLQNGGFETGDATGWHLDSGSSVTSADAYEGSYSITTSNTATKYQGMFYQLFDVVPNSTYTVSFWHKYVGSNTAPSFYPYILSADRKTNIAGGGTTGSTTWKQSSLTFNSGDHEQITLYMKNRTASDGGTYYFDNFSVVGPEVGDEPVVHPVPEDFGRVENGGFEDATGGWTIKYGSRTTEDSYSGDYSLKTTSLTKYGVFAFTDIAVVPNSDYTISFKLKVADMGTANNFRLYTRETSDNNSGKTSLSQWDITDATTEWKTYTTVINSQELNTMYLSFAQGGDHKNFTCSSYYIDDIVLTGPAPEAGGDEPETPSEPEEYVGQYPQQMTSGADIRFMTFNVLADTDKANGGFEWDQDPTPVYGGRGPLAVAMMEYYKPDVIAFEEFSGNWRDYVEEFMPDYDYAGMENPDNSTLNKGNLYTCLAYNKNTVRLLDTDLMKMTNTYWEHQGMRYVNIAFFEVIATGEKFIAAALHPDAGSLTGTGSKDVTGDGVNDPNGYWRPYQLEEAAAYMAAISNQYQQPVIVGGDYNSGLHSGNTDSVSYNKFVDAGFTDATAGRYIDHIFYNGMATHLYETTVADAAVLPASDHKAVFADIQFLDEFATPIKDAKDYIKTQGRNTLKDGALWLDFSASGIEFSANCEGKVALNLNVKSLKQTDSYGGLYFTVIVDGVKKDRAQCHITSTGNVELVLAENLIPGNHTFEVYRQTEHRGAEVGISSIVMNGSFNEKPEDNRLYIEFIGDSISTGFGALGTTSDSDGGSPKWQDATVAYPFLTAKALGADFSDVCYSGIGAKYGWQDPNMLNFYPYQRWQYDRTTQYNFSARQPDVVVIALGTNDIAMEGEQGITVEQRLAGYQELLDMVRAKNPNSKIVWIYGMMKDDDNARIPAIIEENGGAAAGLYSLELVTNTAGAGWHPSAAGQQKFADDLVAFLNSDVLVKYVGDDMLDNDEGRKVSYEASSRMEITADKLGLAFRFKVMANGISIVENSGNIADYTNATIDAFGNGESYKLVGMGAIVSNKVSVGLGDMKLDDVDGKKTLAIAAERLLTLEDGSAEFAVRITNIPLEHESTVIYARAYYIFEYEGRQVVVYDDIQAQNYINKYEQNDGVLEW